MEYFVGIDLGTSSVKLMLVDAEGEIKKTSVREYEVCYPQPGWSEQAPEDWWRGICEGMEELLQGLCREQIRGIGVAGQMHGLVILDENDCVIRPVILWNDGRTEKETAYLNEVVGKERLFERTGNIAFAGFTAPKLLWLREHEPESFGRIKKILLPKDYINYLLTGVHCCDYSDAAGTLLLDVKNKCWSAPMLELCGITEEQMPRLYESFEAVGTLKPSVAKTFGLREDTVVVAGAGDNAAAAVGTGTVGEGKCNISLGTSGTVFVSSSSFSGDEKQAIHSFCHADGGYHLMGCILSAASCHKWLCDRILMTKDYAAEEARVDPAALGKNEVFFLPYLMGERSPINDTFATGLFVGLRPNTQREQLLQAVMEGVAFAIRDNLEIIRSFGIPIEKSTLCGGGAKSPLWGRILANVLNVELELPVSEQGPGYGSAMLAMVGSGRFDRVTDCAKAFFRVKERILPREDLVMLYEKRYQQFRRIYPAVKTLYRQWKEQEQ